MKILTDTTFADALTKCYETPNYKVCIAFSSSVNYIPFINELAKQQDESRHSFPGVKMTRFHHTSSIISFRNGSIIEIWIVTERQRGKKFNEILCDEFIGDEMLNRVLLPMQLPRTDSEDSMNNYAQEVENYTDDNEELDNFINSLKIVPKNRCGTTVKT